MILLLLVLSLLIAIIIYKRYVPVKGVPCIEGAFMDKNTITLDIRDYNEAGNDLTQDSLQIPYAYLRRFNNEIPNGNIHVIASDRLELNMGLRFLIRKGFTVISYEIADFPCKQKGGLEQHGVR